MKLSQLELLISNIKAEAAANVEDGGAVDPDVTFWIDPAFVSTSLGAFLDMEPRADVLDPNEPLRQHTAGLGQFLAEKPEMRGNFQIPLMEVDLDARNKISPR